MPLDSVWSLSPLYLWGFKKGVEISGSQYLKFIFGEIPNPFYESVIHFQESVIHFQEFAIYFLIMDYRFLIMDYGFLIMDYGLLIMDYGFIAKNKFTVLKRRQNFGL